MAVRKAGEMKSAEYGPYDLLDELDFARSLAANPDAVRSFMFEICERFVGGLPEVVVAGLREAREFHSGASNISSLEGARVACWNALGTGSCNLEDAAVCRVRAAICTMYPDGGDPFCVVHAFLGFASTGGVPDAELLDLMRHHLRVTT